MLFVYIYTPNLFMIAIPWGPLVALLLLPPCHPPEISSQLEQCLPFLLGIRLVRKGYPLYNLQIKQIYTFHETIFPFHTTQPDHILDLYSLHSPIFFSLHFFFGQNKLMVMTQDWTKSMAQIVLMQWLHNVVIADNPSHISQTLSPIWLSLYPCQIFLLINLSNLTLYKQLHHLHLPSKIPLFSFPLEDPLGPLTLQHIFLTMCCLTIIMAYPIQRFCSLDKRRPPYRAFVNQVSSSYEHQYFVIRLYLFPSGGKLGDPYFRGQQYLVPRSTPSGKAFHWMSLGL